MSFDTEKSYPKIPSAGPEVGIWHETKKRELEATVLSEIHSLGKKFTKKEIQTLLAHVETAQSVDGLRNSLTQKENAVLSDDIIRELLGLAGRIRELAQ